MYKRSYNTFCSDSYVDDVKNICWSVVCNEEQPDAALDTFMKLLIPVTNKHAAIKKMSKNWNPCGLMRNWKIVWLRGMRKKEWQIWKTYCKLRNHVNKMNKKIKKLHYDTKINDKEFTENNNNICLPLLYEEA